MPKETHNGKAFIKGIVSGTRCIAWLWACKHTAWCSSEGIEANIWEAFKARTSWQMPEWTYAECMRVIEFSDMATMPKGQFSGQDYLDFAIADAVVHFNDGQRGHIYIFPLLGFKMGLHSKVYYEIRDSRRISASARKITKKIRQSKRTLKKAEEDMYKQC